MLLRGVIYGPLAPQRDIEHKKILDDMKIFMQTHS